MNYFAVRLSRVCLFLWCLALTLTLFQSAVFAGGRHQPDLKKNARTLSRKQVSLWRQMPEDNLPALGRRLLTPAKYALFNLNQKVLAELLTRAPLEFTGAARQKAIVMELPMPDGTLARFRIEESPILAPQVAIEMPGAKTFSGQGIDDPAATARLDWIPAKGFHGFVLSQSGTIYIDPAQENDRENYLVFYKHEYGATENQFNCRLNDYSDLNRTAGNSPADPVDFSSGGNLRTYRLAIAGTAEYTANRGGQASALADVTTAVNRITGIYRRDAAVSFTLVSGTNTLFTNTATDGYANDGDIPDLDANQTNLNNIIGAPNYDIGHLFETSNGGIAYTPSVCNASLKGKGLSGLPNPIGDPFVVDYVAHEMGHQFSGQHSYNNSGDGGCTTRSAADAFEPASGATIMSYVGICNPRNLQGNSLDIFSVQSLAQVISERNNASANRGGSCGTLTTPGNTPPTIAALTNYTIPRNTPFALTAAATDVNGDTLTYSWEENDTGTASFSGGAADTDADGNARPIFRLYAPVASGTRSFPSLTYILNNANVPPATYTGTSPTGAVCNFGNCITGESLPSINRVMSFRVAVRDNNAAAGGAADATMTVTINAAAGPFQITAPNTAVSWQAGTTQTVTWDVNGSTANAANVKISLSTDGGLTFPTTILASTPNDGSESITVPNATTNQARVKVEAVGNIFFDIGNTNFTITAPTAATADLSGVIRTNEGTPLRGVAVSLLNTSTGTMLYTRTDSRGQYKFTAVETGASYIVTPTRPAYIFNPQNTALSFLGEQDDLNFVGVPRN